MELHLKLHRPAEGAQVDDVNEQVEYEVAKRLFEVWQVWNDFQCGGGGKAGRLRKQPAR